MYLHIDCNTFFASCEVATRPGLEGKPVVVANDNEAGGGIILALTPQAKQLGLKRGIPLFQVRGLIKLNHVVVCPVDHKKYRRISKQIMEAVQQQGIVLDFIQYSVDEFFGRLPVDDPDQMRRYTQKVKDLITSTSGIPVSCGCAETYTLAKAATHFAKRHAGYEGICVLPPEKRERALALLEVGEVWGIGRKNVKKLTNMGVRTALDFVQCDPHQLSQIFSVTGMRTWQELQGIPSIDLHRPDQQRSIMQSRTFAYMTSKFDDLDTAVRTFTADCAYKLRQQKGVCRTVTVFLSTNRHRDDLEQYRNSASCRLATASADTGTLTKAAIEALKQVFVAGYLYKQAGVILQDITQQQGMQLDLFSEPQDERRRKAMEVADQIRKKFGEGKI